MLWFFFSLKTMFHMFLYVKRYTKYFVDSLNFVRYVFPFWRLKKRFVFA